MASHTPYRSLQLIWCFEIFLSRDDRFASTALVGAFYLVYITLPEPVPAALEAWPWKNPQGILVSPMDKRHYRWLRLPNGLQVLPRLGPRPLPVVDALSVPWCTCSSSLPNQNISIFSPPQEAKGI